MSMPMDPADLSQYTFLGGGVASPGNHAARQDASGAAMVGGSGDPDSDGDDDGTPQAFYGPLVAELMTDLALE